MEESISPLKAFEDNIRPAELLLSVYRLLESKSVETQGAMIDKLRELVGANQGEELMLIYNRIFVGLVRERAKIPVADLKEAALRSLLRQAVVAACTALETYLPAVLKANLPAVIEAKGRDFMPQDKELQGFFTTLTLDLATVVRLLGDPDAPLFLANKIVGFVDFKYLSGPRGIHVVGCLLGIPDPWQAIAANLAREPQEMQKVLDQTIKRRNNIVHRADRSQSDPQGDQQDIAFAWTKHAVDTVMHACLALDELVAQSVSAMRLQVVA